MTSIPSLSRRVSIPRPARKSAAAATAGTTGNRERWLLPIAIVVAALVGLAGWMLLVSPLREDTAAVKSQTATVDVQVATLRSQLAELQAQQADLPKYRADLAASQAALPTTAALPVFLRTLQDLGTKTGTTVTGLDAKEPTGATGATSTGTGAVGTVYEVPITLTVSGSYDGLTAFVAALQADQPRAVLVDSIAETAGEAGRTALTITMSAFVAPTAGAAGNGG